MKPYTNLHWCDVCKKTYQQDIFKSCMCAICGAEDTHIHQVLKSKEDNVYDIIVVTEDNFKDVLPSKLIYFYNQLKEYSMTFSHLKIADYSLSRDAITNDGKQWYGNKKEG